MRRGKCPCTGTIIFGCDLEFKHQNNYNGINLLIIFQCEFPAQSIRLQQAEEGA
jgi:hypothetical protein